MGEFKEVRQLQIRGDERITLPSPENAKATNLPASPSSSKLKEKQYILISTYIVFILAGQTIAILLGQFYYKQGGSSTWLFTAVTSGCLPIYFFISASSNPSDSPPLKKLLLPYMVIGIFTALDNLMCSYGLLYLPVSTFSLVCSTQLAFNVVFSYFLNSQELTALIINSVVLVTFSAVLLGVSPDHENSTADAPKNKYSLGFILTLAASAVFSFLLSVMELMYQKVLKMRKFFYIFELVVFMWFLALVGLVAGLFASGEWRGLGITVCWQLYGIGVIGLTLVVSPLFSNMICTVGLPLVPVFAVVFFKDEMDGVKVLALFIALWGFLSYLYQDYIDYFYVENEEKSDDMSSH